MISYYTRKFYIKREKKILLNKKNTIDIDVKSFSTTYHNIIINYYNIYEKFSFDIYVNFILTFEYLNHFVNNVFNNYK